MCRTGSRECNVSLGALHERDVHDVSAIGVLLKPPPSCRHRWQSVAAVAALAAPAPAGPKTTCTPRASRLNLSPAVFCCCYFSGDGNAGGGGGLAGNSSQNAQRILNIR